MAKLRITREQFLDRMHKMHPNYDFRLFEYKGNAVKSTVICPKHGAFEMHPNSLSNGQGCRLCGIERRSDARRGCFSEFVQQARAVHGDAYEYDESSWKGNAEPVSIFCKKHNITFKQKYHSHIRRKSGCPKCGKERMADAIRDDQASFLEKCIAVHGDKYDLSRVVYTKSQHKVELVCRKHGSFFVLAGNILNSGTGCPLCAHEKNGQRLRKKYDEYLSDFVKIHGNRYTYLETFYTDSKAYVRVVCPQHGEFTQLVSDHRAGHGCSLCGVSVWDTESFIIAARKVHGDIYDYSKVVYTKAHDYVTTICKKHGEFQQGATYHVNNGHGCPACGKVITSKGQAEVASVVSEHVPIIENYRLPSKRHIDIFIPSLNIGIEYHGLIWHSEKFQSSHMKDYAKHREAAAFGIRIIHIYADEWQFRGHVVEALLRNAIGVRTDKVFARECSVSLVDDTDAIPFYEDTHIQGFPCAGCTHLGLWHNNNLVALMSFSRVTSIRGSTEDPTVRELRRFSTSISVVGGASKLLAAFLRCETRVKTIVSYSDNRLFSGGLYKKLGFEAVSVSEPSYCYVSPRVKWREEKHKFTRARMSKRPGFHFDPDKSEKENCADNNWYRVYDCGKTRWVLHV